MGRRRAVVAGALAAAALAAGACASAPAPAEISLSAVRHANARYQYLANAIVDGYYPSGGCMQDPRGAMGQHYLNPAHAGRVDPLHPPELFYVPVDGTLRLAGVEYYVPATAVATPPLLFGRSFDGPMPGHFLGQPDHYDLHVWLYIDNPAGLFAAFDPDLSCG